MALKEKVKGSPQSGVILWRPRISSFHGTPSHSCWALSAKYKQRSLVQPSGCLADNKHPQLRAVWSQGAWNFLRGRFLAKEMQIWRHCNCIDRQWVKLVRITGRLATAFSDLRHCEELWPHHIRNPFNLTCVLWTCEAVIFTMKVYLADSSFFLAFWGCGQLYFKT